MTGLLVGGLTLGLAACGTTAPSASRAGGGLESTGGAIDSQGQPRESSPDATTANGPGVSGTGGTSGSGPSSAGRQTRVAGQAPPSVSGTPLTGGATTSALAPVKVGFAYSANVGAFMAAFGIKGSATDGSTYIKALIKYANANGGIGGHTVTPVLYNVDLTRSDPYSVFMQEMCAQWTQDNHVIAGIFPANVDARQLASCLAKSGAVFDNSAAWVRSQKDYQAFPNWFEPEMYRGERLARSYVDVPERLGYFGKKPKIGLLVYDYPASGQMGKAMTAELTARGYAAPIIETIHMGTSTADLSNTIAAVQSTVLKFRAQGVDHVMSAAYPGAISFFAIYAQSQEYYPRYALTSSEGLPAVAANVPAAELKDAVAVGWQPQGDVDAAKQPTPNATTQLCYKIYAAAGIAAPDRPGGLQYCNFVLMLRAGAQKLSPTGLSSSALYHGLEGLGNSYSAPGGFGSSLSRAKHDGTDHVRGIRFEQSCACFAYTGPLIPG